MSISGISSPCVPTRWRTNLIELQNLGKVLPHYLERRMLTLSQDVKSQYRALDCAYVVRCHCGHGFADTIYFTGLSLDLAAHYEYW